MPEKREDLDRSQEEGLRAARKALELGLLREEDFRDVPKPAPPPPSRVGKYEIQGEISRGGMAVVYKAFDPDRPRGVAIKCLLESADVGLVLRFQQEARALARLSHPHIVPVLEVGTDRGRPFLVVEYLDGQTLDQTTLDVRNIVEVMRTVCEAIHFVHGQGIIHRDLKPENLLLDKGGHVWVLDFGVARIRGADAAASLTSTGDVLGTPSYMSPEQALGRSREVDERTDIWGVGATMYALLTKRAPFSGDSIHTILRAIAQEQPVPPRQILPTLPPELEPILLRCLEKDPARRYSSAAALGEDLSRFLAGEPPAAVSPSPRRSRVRSRAAWLLAVGVIAAGGSVAFLYRSAPRPPPPTRREEPVELRSAVSQLLREADGAVRAGESKRAEERLEEGIRLCRRSLEGGDFAEGRYLLGRLLAARGHDREALSEFERALQLNSGLDEARWLRGFVRVREYDARFRAAWGAEVSEGNENSQPDSVRERVARLLFHRRLGKRGTDGEDSGVSLIAAVESADPALAVLREKIEHDLAPLSESNPALTDLERLSGRACLHRLRGEWDEAERCRRTLLESYPAHLEALLEGAWVAELRGRHEDARREADWAVFSHRGSASVYRLRSLLAVRWSDKDPYSNQSKAWRAGALEDVDRAIQIQGIADPESLVCRARIRIQLHLNAQEDLARIRSGEIPALAIRLYQAMGDRSREEGRSAEAAVHWRAGLEILDRALHRNPEAPLLLVLRAEVKLSLEDLPGAEGDVRKPFPCGASLPSPTSCWGECISRERTRPLPSISWSARSL